MVPSPRQIAMVGLLAIVPVLAYAVGNVDAVAAVAAGNVVLIVASLWSMFGPHDRVPASG
jgi:hypothetical protein